MSATAPVPLTIDGSPIECTIGGTETQEYILDLTAGQFVAVTAMQNGVDVIVEVYAPDGDSLMEVDSNYGAWGPEDAFVTAEVEGTYRIVIRPWENSGPGRYTITAQSAVLFTAERAKIKSPRLRQLWEELFSEGSDGSEAVTKFIREREEAKEPLLEANPGDDSRVLVTLIYPGDANTRSVRVQPAPSADGYLKMERFANTDLWTVSVLVPNDTRLFYAFQVRKAVPLPTGAENPPPVCSEQMVPDPWNPTGSLNSSDLSSFALPATPVQLYAQEPEPGTPRGNVEQRELHSVILNETRPYLVYMPPGYDPKHEASYGVLVVFDGEIYSKDVPTPTYLDNLIAANKIPPMIAVLVHSLGTRTRDLACSAPFTDFLVTELLPAVRAEFPGATNRAERTIAAGASLGGACAAYCGLTHPETFGNVLSQMGAFWPYSGWKPEDFEDWETKNSIPPYATIPTGFLKSERLPLRFYMNIGTFEGPSMLRLNRHVRDILLAKGYDVTYSEYHGGHETDCLRYTLPDGLMALTRDWREA